MERTLQLRTEVDGKPVSAKITYTVIRPPPADPHKCYHCDSRKAVVLKYTISETVREEAGGELTPREQEQIKGDFYRSVLAMRPICSSAACAQRLEEDQEKQHKHFANMAVRRQR